ncbi:uncharacterized protein Pyn_28597 [Prunus yedoensis var. nudiflora]|uniref:Uncharacterized protein n=1 Tax=Prunus yedoensis var. nudiflora TaxID=2094558 RepID=A0A314ZMN3_PRUYE|nr:uncharacterized protein Pyn_28597 [Prunus yedoensis var. nudiflora]
MIQAYDTCTYAPFKGRPVVVYALHGLSNEEIIAYSFRMDKDDDGGVAYSLSKLFQLQGLKIAHPPLPFYDLITEYLVHLGKLDFCHVIMIGSCNIAPREVQYLSMTTF